MKKLFENRMFVKRAAGCDSRSSSAGHGVVFRSRREVIFFVESKMKKVEHSVSFSVFCVILLRDDPK
jgi:hypothetical protein